MKITYIALSGLLITILISCNQKAAESKQSSLETNVEQASYIIGYNSIKQLVSQGDLDLDKTAMINGVSDALDNADSKLTAEVMQQAMQQYQQAIQEKVKAAQEAAGAANLAEGKAYMEANAKKPGVIVDKSGVQYKILIEGKDPKPESTTSTVRVNYEGRLLDGTVFDSSYQRGEPIEFALNRVIKGWTEAVQLMPEGSTWEVTIPGDLAYGPGGTGGVIGPNATLIFKIELIKANVTQDDTK